jgi:hypothetical protein
MTAIAQHEEKGHASRRDLRNSLISPFLSFSIRKMGTAFEECLKIRRNHIYEALPYHHHHPLPMKACSRQSGHPSSVRAKSQPLQQDVVRRKLGRQ